MQRVHPVTPLDQLRVEAERPDLSDIVAWDYTLGGHGRALVDGVITDLDKKAPLLLEVGSFLGASARRWLRLRDDLTVIGLDLWGDELIEQCARYVGRPALTRAYPDRETQERFAADVARQGPYPTALKNVEAFGDRFIPVRDRAPDAFARLKAKGITPDILYLDADKSYGTLEAAHTTWPSARITGDDWHWNRTKGYPMRQVVYAFAEKYGFTVEAQHATWVLRKS